MQATILCVLTQTFKKIDLCDLCSYKQDFDNFYVI